MALPPGDGPLYQRLADRLGDDIRAGTIAAGSQLPTQRDLAIELGTTVGTVGRAYSLLHERGLVSQAVGRGTYVKSYPPAAVTASVADLPEKSDLLVMIADLEARIADLRAMVEKL